MFVNGRFGFEAALASVAGLLVLTLLFVVIYVRDLHADPTLQGQSDLLSRLFKSMVSFVKEVHASFWQSGRGPKFGVAFAMLPIGALALAYALTAMPTLLLAVQIGDAGLQSVPMKLFYGIIVAHGLFFGTAFGVRNAIFMGMANIAISIGNYWQGVVAESMGYAVVLYLDALFAVLVILVIPLLRDREERPATARVTAEPLLVGE